MAGQGSRTIVVVGARAVGKTSIVHRLIEEPTDFSSYRPTIDECYNISWQLPDRKKILQVRIIDTAAWNEFPAMQNLCIKMAHLVVVVYDVTSPHSVEEMLTLVSEVKGVKGDIDILVVGNKCDNLRKEDKFMPNNVTEKIGSNCIGHMYTSAKSEQGIMGLKQLILCSKSKLTDGFYTELAQMPKRRKLKKKLHGIAINLHKRTFRNNAIPVLPASVLNKCSSLNISGNTKQAELDGNSNEVYRPKYASNGARGANSDSMKSRHTLNMTHQRLSQFEGEEVLFSDHEVWPSSGSQSDYSTSPSDSPMFARTTTTNFNFTKRRKSMDFSKLELVTDPLVHRNSKQKLSRKKSVSCNGGELTFHNAQQDDANLFVSHANNHDSSESNARTICSDGEDDVFNNSHGSCTMTILLNNMSLDRQLLPEERSFVKSSGHLARHRITRKSKYSRHHRSAEDLLNIRQETLVRQ